MFLKPTRVADAAPHALAVRRRSPTPPGSAAGRRRRRPSAGSGIAAQPLEQLGDRRRAVDGLPGGQREPVAIALRSRSSTGSSPSAAASLSICAS